MTTILITGANRGIGLEFVRQYAKDGATIIAAAREPEKAKELGEIERASGGKVRVLPLAVNHSHSIAQLKKTLGDTPIDILINNAGVRGTRDEREPKLDIDAWMETLRINSVAPYEMARAFHENLKRGKDKKLVTITSWLGSTAGHGGDGYAYRASKAAVNNIMHGLSREWAKDGISVGIFHPGWVRTDMGGKSAPVSPEESVAGLRKRIAELGASNSGSYRDYNNQEIAW
jgi:NAD(P)-dependent dehydrogenase (short-subunit alcohol dehydrogenase family)